MVIPAAYKLYLERFKKFSYCGKITKEKAKQILTWYYRIPRGMDVTILHEMFKLKLIDLSSRKFVYIVGLYNKADDERIDDNELERELLVNQDPFN